MKLQDFIVKSAIRPSLQARTRDEVIRELVNGLAEADAIARSQVEELVAAVIAREKDGTTGFGKGVAVPHIKNAKVKKMVGTIGRSVEGIDFGALDKQPVYTIFLLLSPENQNQHHMQAMNVIFQNLQKDMFRKFLRQSDTQDKVFDLLVEADLGR